jgi:ribosomal protein S18 acetylase RimI-like enzyme
MSFKVRRFHRSDALEASEMLRAAFEPLHKGNTEYWLWKSFDPARILVNSRTQNILVALSSKRRIIGYISSTNTLYGASYVPTVGVHPDFQRKGVGKLLLDAKLRELRKQGVRKVWLLVTSTNTGAILFYLKNNFVIEGFLRDHTAPGVHEVLMSKFL